MNLIQLALGRPMAVVAAVLMVVMFGIVALQTIPIQLAPDIRRPVISVRTSWPGAAPVEVEREIVNRQEEALRGITGLKEISSSSSNGRARVTLEFGLGQDMDKALLLVSNRLDRVSGYPDEADEPTLDTAGNDDVSIAFYALTRLPGNDRPMNSYGDFIENVVQERLERVVGVSQTGIWGGSNRQMLVTVDPAKMARYRLTVPQVLDALRGANASVSAGTVDEGKRRYLVRTESEFNTVDQIRAVALRSIEDANTGRIARVTLGDIADVEFSFKERSAFMRYMGEPGVSLFIGGEAGANVIETMAGIKEAVEELNANALPEAGLELTHVYDETTYIDSAIDLVQQNVIVGGSMAALVLLVFLRSWSATVIIGLAIPVSVIGSFVAMAAMGRSINVISLAGIAFAVGMVVDAAIVVLENIYRLRQEGRPLLEAAYQGTRQVWGAVLVSALTTVLVFVPILMMDLAIGQLFRDIAVAISVAVMLSLLVAVTLIPALSNRLLPAGEGAIRRLRLPIIDDIGRGIVSLILGYARMVVRHRIFSLFVVATVCGVTVVATFMFLPKLEYLPEGNRNLVIGSAQSPPGYNPETAHAVATKVEDMVRPYFAKEGDPPPKAGDPPRIEHFFFVARSSFVFVRASAVDETRASELIPLIRRALTGEPGFSGFVAQPSLFGREVGSGRSINLNISGPDLEAVLETAIVATELIEQALPRDQGTQVRPRPGLELGAPEVRVIPDPLLLADNGISARELGITIDAFNDGLRVAEITVDGERVDLTLSGPEHRISETQGIENLPVVTRSGKILPVSSLAKVVVTSGPTQIRHIERERTVTLSIRPAADIPLETAMEIVETEVMDKLRQTGLPPGFKLRMSGTASQLTEAWSQMVLDLAIAVAIVFLVMAVLFESFLYPLIIMFSVPLATAGGVGGLVVLNLFVRNQLDMLTLLGFIILIGIVVNNAILLVHQTIYHVRNDGMASGEAILAATRNRIRPIFMSTLTSIFGMLPLVLFPGAGSELYRGLGSVVIGGLALSALLTLLIIPPLLSMVVEVAETRRKRPSRMFPADETPGAGAG